MKFIFIVAAILVAVYSFFEVYRKSKYNRYSNLSNLLLIVVLGILVAFFPIKNPTLDYSETNDSLTVTKDGGIFVADIGGEETKDYALKLDVEKEYINVLLSDGENSVPYSTFTFTEETGITYDLEYDGTNDEFYLYRSFGVASGFNVLPLLSIILIVLNLILMVSRVLREKETSFEQTRFKISVTQRIINVLERASLIALLTLFASYFILLFVDYPLDYIYYFKDSQYLALCIGLMFAPILISFFIELIRKEFAYEVLEDSVKVFSGSNLVFEAQGESFDMTESLIRNTRSIGKDYIQMSANLIDESSRFEGLSIDLKPLGSAQAFMLLDKLRSLNKSGDQHTSKHDDIDGQTHPKQEQEVFVLTGKESKASDTRNTLIFVGAFAAVFLLITVNSYRIMQTFGSMFTIVLILGFSILPIILIILYQVRLNKNIGILTVVLNEDSIQFNDTHYELNQHLVIEMPYPDSVSARFAKIMVKSYGSNHVYTIKRNHKIPQDAYYDLYTEISHKHPTLLKVK